MSLFQLRPASLSELLEQEFSLPYFEFVYDEHEKKVFRIGFDNGRRI